jgi:hypothetical protein
MSARAHSGSGFIGVLLGVALMIILALGIALMWAQDGREGPIRSAELSIPTPKLPDPPALPPRTESVLPTSP